MFQFSQSCHIEALTIAPRRRSDVAAPWSDQNDGRVAARKVAHHTRPSADLPHDSFQHSVIASHLRTGTLVCSVRAGQ